MRNLIALLTVLMPLVAQPPVPQRPGAGAPACTLASQETEATLSGTVSDASGAALPDATVTAVCGAFRAETRTGVNGGYTLALPKGTLRIRVTSARFTAAERDVTMAADSAVQADFTLRPEDVHSSVSVTAQIDYIAEETNSGAKLDLPLLEIPQSITVVTRKVLDDQGAVRLDDALRNVAGVMPGGYYEGWDYYRIRGFDSSFTTYLDGLRGGNGTADEIGGLEAVEVMKGPSSALYGQGVLGGLVNLRSKRPKSDALLNLEYTGGSFAFNSPSVDFGGSLNRSRTLYGRVFALDRRQDTFVDYAHIHRAYVVPSVTWRITPATSLTLLGRYQQDNGRHAFPLPAKGTVLPNINGEIPVSRYVGELGNDDNSVHEDNRQLGWEFTHQFREGFRIRQNGRVAVYRQIWKNLLYPGFLDADERTLYRYPLSYDQNWKNYAIDTSVDGVFHTGAVRHEVVVGVDYFRNPTVFSGESIDFSDMSQYTPIDLFHPVYGQSKPTALIPAYAGHTLMQFTGLYFQDHLRLGRRLTITAGGRMNFTSNRDLPDPSHTDSAFTPRIGANYQILPGLALYGSYSRSFLPQSGRVYDAGSENGTFAPPEKGRQWEGGVKSSLLNGRLSSTLALYDLRRGNVLTTDLGHPNFSIVTGQQRSRGVEAESTFLLHGGWSLTAAYAFNNAKVTEDNTIPVGTPTQNAPRHAFNLWTRYEIQRGWAKGLGIGLGGRRYGDQSGDLFNTFQLPGYGLLEGSLSYRVGHFGIQFNAYNLSNTRYFTGSYDSLYVKPGAPRSARVTVRWSF
ncbi:TonB-dependent siderophore receptor [uncultured Paludibaculum sp.]|uniref:TonB-dependent siderophore receptor n=1 Tax=uncultured Paludibaculum sp. TaxID=1765020 RepID=UPI002AAB0C08|nr:TonB-dependent siderophore receptor [uncultured Paludibaculum sp.]